MIIRYHSPFTRSHPIRFALEELELPRLECAVTVASPSGANRCRCTRQIPSASAFGVLDVERLEYARHSGPALRVVAEADESEASASILKTHP